MKKILIISLVVLTAPMAFSQKGGELTKIVDVTKELTPDPHEAVKLGISPVMVDTVKLRPEISYDIAPSPKELIFGTKATPPTKINADRFIPYTPLYVKVGAGYPLNTLLDAYYTSDATKKYVYGAQVNHKGFYGKAKNDLGDKLRALNVTTDADIFGYAKLGRYTLRADFGFDNSQYDAYGMFLRPEWTWVANLGDSERLSYSTFKGGVSFGDSFNDMSHFNLRVSGGLYHLSDRINNKETGVTAQIKMGGELANGHVMTGDIDYMGFFGAKNLNGYTNHILSFTPRYMLSGDNFSMNIGAKVVFDNNGAWRVFPLLNIKYDLGSSRVIPFVDLDGGVVTNNFRSNIQRNPFIGHFDIDGREYPVVNKNGGKYNLSAGISGSFSSSVEYRAYVGGAVERGINKYINYYTWRSTSRFLLSPDDIKRVFIAAEVEARIGGGFSLDGQAMLNFGWAKSKDFSATGIPLYNVDLGFKYEKGRISARIGSEFTGRRKFNEYSFETALPQNFENITTTTILPTVNITAEVKVKITSRISGYVLGENLAGSKLYYFNHYPSPGPSVNAGVVLLF